MSSLFSYQFSIQHPDSKYRCLGEFNFLSPMRLADPISLSSPRLKKCVNVACAFSTDCPSILPLDMSGIQIVCRMCGVCFKCFRSLQVELHLHRSISVTFVSSVFYLNYPYLKEKNARMRRRRERKEECEECENVECGKLSVGCGSQKAAPPEVVRGSCSS